uniref:DNA replication licensing factor MCM3 n=1 Tax=Strigamia maritima TaxID=126957 RepID=T1JLC5_STRMM
MEDGDLEQKIREIQSEYLGFLDDEQDQGTYIQAVKDMISDKQRRLIVSINDLRKSKFPKRADKLLSCAFEEIIAFQRALKEIVAQSDPVYAKEYDEFFIGFEGSFGSRHVSPRTLTARFLGNVVCVEGIVTKCSLVRPKIVRSVHYCPATQKTIERKYTDLTSYDAFPSSSIYPTKDEDGNLLETEYGLSIYKDHQTFSIQEMPEKSPPGQLPRSVDVIVDNDLVDVCKPGERVQIIGVYRCLPGKQGSFTSGAFRTVLIANNIKVLSKDVIPTITREDVTKCRSLSGQRNMDVFELLAKGLAPSIHGHEYIKKALLCMLVGGVEKVLPNGTRLRGDINILLIGDPSVAKSQLLRYVLHSAPRAIPTTGRGSSGVGLTAAVTTDHETGERRLEAGAMVLADRGVVCIDEFDKMSDIDRTAIHEVMEQGRVTIAKAGIHAQLNARCSVLAAANPVYGRYDQYRTPMENIGLQDSLLSRFDLLFIVLDIIDPEQDRKISDHVVRMHRYRNPGEQDGEALPMGLSVDLLATKDPNAEEVDDNKLQVYEKYDPLLHGSTRGKREKIVSVQFMKKYIHVARLLKPVLTRDAAECIAEEYSRLRSHESENNDVARTQPVTPRTLETLIRLATAHAKIRLSSTVMLEDAQTAIELIQFAYFKKVMERSKKRRRVSVSDEEEELEDEENEEVVKPRKRTRQRKQPGEEGFDPYDIDGIDDVSIQGTPKSSSRDSRASARSSRAEVTADERMEVDQAPVADKDDNSKHIYQVYKIENSQSVPVKELMSYLKKEETVEPFDYPEVDAALKKMDAAYEVMVTEGVIFLI